MTRAAYDVIVRVTVTANSPQEARDLVERFLPDPAWSQEQPRMAFDDPRGPHFPIDSWAVLTESRVIGVKASRTHDRVTWQAVEVS